MKTIFNFCSCPLLMLSLLLIAATVSANPYKKFNVQCVLVEKAKIARHSLAKEGKFGRANYGHQIAAGKRSVLAVRVYINDGRGVDSDLFKKATLEFKSPQVIGVGNEITVNVLRSNYSEGGSAWVADGGYSWAANPFPHFQMRRDSSGLHVTLKASFDTTSASHFFSRPGQSSEVAVECPVVRQTVTELTPWVGMVVTNSQSFYLQE